MAQENVEIVRRGYEHFNRSGEVDYSVLDSEIVYDLSRRTFDPLVLRGHEGVREFLRMHALKHPAYAERYQRNKRRLGKQHGAKVAQVDIARRLTHAIWHMLTRNQQFAPRGAAVRLAA